MTDRGGAERGRTLNLNRSRFMRGGKNYKRFAGLAVAVVLFAGVGLALVLFAGLWQFPSSSPRPVRAGDQREAKPMAAELVTAIRNADAQVDCFLAHAPAQHLGFPSDHQPADADAKDEDHASEEPEHRQHLQHQSGADDEE